MQNVFTGKFIARVNSEENQHRVILREDGGVTSFVLSNHAKAKGFVDDETYEIVIRKFVKRSRPAAKKSSSGKTGDKKAISKEHPAAKKIEINGETGS